MKKGPGSDQSKNFKLIHQTLCITSIDFQRQCIFGFVELNILPLANSLTRVKLNGKQWIRIYRVCMKEERQSNWLDVGFQFEDPNKTVCSDSKKRNLEYFSSCHQSAVAATERDKGGGEITIKIPKELLGFVSERKMLQISIEFSLEHPDGGIQFVIPEGQGTLAERSCHMFTCGLANSSRLWFPCIDSYSEVCTWNIDVTVDCDMVCVSCGELVEQVLTADERRKTYHYSLNIPTSAPNIALAVGPFEIHVDPVMPEVTHFCLPGLMPALKHSTAFINEVFEFYEECLSCRYPYTYYKQVFVDQAYLPASSYASMTIFSTNLLHSARIIDQTFETRKMLSYSLAQQFFGVYLCMQTWADAWLPISISGYLFGLYMKRAFGNNEYRYWIHQEMSKVCHFEIEGPGLSPLHQTSSSSSLSTTGSQSTTGRPDSPALSNTSNPILHQLHPHLSSGTQSDVAKSKAHLVMRMIELRIGQESLLQVYNKLLSLASTAVQTKYDMHTWGNMLISTSGFLKSISTVSGKDINVFVDQWICRSGVAKFLGSFVFNRKRNIVELELKQDMSKGALKYVGPLTVCVQELDGSFNHIVQIEDAVSRHEIPCHSKSRRNKKKKIPLMTGEEVDMNLDAMDSDSPVLWIRIDPEVTWLRHVTFQQPDYMWQYQLRYERDIMAQSQAIDALEHFPAQASRDALTDIINQQECFYKIRLEAIKCLAKIATASASSWSGHLTMINMFRSMFGSTSCPTIVQYNNFKDFIGYYIQKSMPVAIASIRNVHSQCSKEVVQFILDLLKYNDNRLNHVVLQNGRIATEQYSDSYYLSSLIDALATTITPAVVMATSVSGTIKLSEECGLVLGEIMRYLNLEKLLPSYRYTITCSCLKALRTMQKNGHIPADPIAFKYYSRYGHFEDVRLSAIESLIDLVKVESSSSELEVLLDIIEHDPSPYVRHCTVNMLSENPPFTRKMESSLNTLSLVEKLWYLMNCETVSDPRLRCDLMELYNVLWGRVTPSCVPPQGCGIVIDLKERKIMNLSPLPPVPSPAHDYSITMSGEDTPITGKKSHKRKCSRPSTPNTADLSLLENQPDTPLSVESTASDGSKLRFKIKLGNDESGGESGTESLMSRADSEAVTPSIAEHKKHKKKKKKKHKHREPDKSRKLSTSSSNYDSPLMLDMTAAAIKKEPDV